MDPFLFYEILNQAEVAGVKGIRFARWGEPTLHPNFREFLIAARKGTPYRDRFFVHVNTNGTGGLEIANALAMWATSVKISVHDQNLDELARFTEAVYAGSDFKPYVAVWVQKERPDLPEILDRFRGICSQFILGETKDLTQPKTTGTIIGCPEVNGKMSINYDGTVSACCADYNKEMIIGDLRDTPLMGIWNGWDATFYRSAVRRSSLLDLNVCQRCPYVV